MVMESLLAGSLGLDLDLDLDLNKGVHLVRREGEGLKRLVFPPTRKISRLIEAVAILTCRVIWHVHTARNDDNRLASVRPVGGVWIVTFGAKTSDGQTVRRQTGSALRRFQWLTSVAFGATSFPRKEAIQPRLRRK